MHRRDALARGDEEVHGINPLVKWDFGCSEYRAVPHCEREFLARAATIGATGTRRHASAGMALRAGWSVRPQAAFEVDSSGFLIGEPLEELKGTDGGARHLEAAPELALVREREHFSPCAVGVTREHAYVGVSDWITADRCQPYLDFECIYEWFHARSMIYS